MPRELNSVCKPIVARSRDIFKSYALAESQELIGQGQYLVAHLIGITFADALLPRRALGPSESWCWMGGVILTWAFLGLATVQRLEVGSPRGWASWRWGRLRSTAPREPRAGPASPESGMGILLFVPTAAALAAYVSMMVLLLLRSNRASTNGAG